MFPDQKSGAMIKPYTYTNSGSSMGKPTGETKAVHGANSGSASRFFKACEFTEDDIPAFIYCAKASRQEREQGCDEISPKEKAKGYRNVTGNAMVDRIHGVGKVRKNNHPTVKPLTLMRYMCKLVTPPGGVVLDPFTGSGTTLMAAKMEGFAYIGIEIDASYITIAQGRIDGILIDKKESINQLKFEL